MAMDYEETYAKHLEWNRDTNGRLYYVLWVLFLGGFVFLRSRCTERQIAISSLGSSFSGFWQSSDARSISFIKKMPSTQLEN